MRAALFPGQGIPAAQVLEGLPDEDRYVQTADEVLGYPLRQRVQTAVQTGSKLTTVLAQPAIYVASMVAYRRATEEGAPFDFLAGHSLGEFGALTGGEAFTFKRGLSLVKARAAAMEKAARAHPGGMAAIIGLGRDKVEELATRSGLEVANDNAPGQLVVSGSDEGLAAAAGMVTAEGGRIVRLEVSGPFHTSAMDGAAEELKVALEATDVRSPKLPVLSNLTASPYRAPGEIRQLLTQQVNNPIRWRSCIEWLWENGAREFVDVGPGRVVDGLARRTLKGLEVAVARN
ncbi:MAG: acyltransferase domain-containing protein [Actinobacteria bacterium]|nr:acyltransferase domain-containing protein [Actinomycetota bacterium]